MPQGQTQHLERHQLRSQEQPSSSSSSSSKTELCRSLEYGLLLTALEPSHDEEPGGLATMGGICNVKGGADEGDTREFVDIGRCGEYPFGFGAGTSIPGVRPEVCSGVRR